MWSTSTVTAGSTRRWLLLNVLRRLFWPESEEVCVSVLLSGEGAAEGLNQLAREQMKIKLLADIRMDLTVCELESWPQGEYLHDLHEMIAGLCPCERRNDEQDRC